jgi:signal transduction histidine kinase
MFNALNNYRNLHNGIISDNELISRVKGTTVKKAFEFIDKNIKDMMPALEHIADVEYSFNKPEWIDPEQFVEEYITKKGNGWLNFKSTITWEKGHNQAKDDLKDPETDQLILKKGDAVNMLLFPTDALERVLNNIVSNAQAHGFTDSSRKDYELRFSWHTDGIALIVEIENNGTAIPSDRDTASLLEYGVSSALHQNGHNGIGCNEIDDIMRRYDGRVEIVSSPENEFTVKYVLIFNRSNIVKSFNL